MEICLKQTTQKHRWATVSAFYISKRVKVNLSLFRSTRSKPNLYINIIDSINIIIENNNHENLHLDPIIIKGDLSKLNNEIETTLKDKITGEEIQNSLTQLDIALFYLIAFNFKQINQNIAKIKVPNILNCSNNEILTKVLNSLKKNDQQTNEFVLSLLSECSNIRDLINIKSLNNLISKFESMLQNNKNYEEKDWQKLLSENPFILSQIYHQPITSVEGQFKIKSDTSYDKDGIVDYLYKNSMFNGISLIEIKKPETKLIKTSGQKVQEYRGIPMISNDLIGGILQLEQYKSMIEKKINPYCPDNCDNHDINLILLIGQSYSLDENQKNIFKIFRNSLKDLLIITYDELLDRIKTIRLLFSSKNKE